MLGCLIGGSLRQALWRTRPCLQFLVQTTIMVPLCPELGDFVAVDTEDGPEVATRAALAADGLDQLFYIVLHVAD